MLGQPRECRGCGTPFVQERAGQRYHDPECQVRSNNARQAAQRADLNREYKRRKYDEARPWREFVCESCGETVRTQELRTRRFCSRKCKNDHHNRDGEFRERYKERAKEWRAENRERLNARASAYYYANREVIYARENAKRQATRKSSPWKMLLAGCKSRALEKKLPFDLTEEWAINCWTGRCEATGIVFLCGQPHGTPRTFWPTIDKIDPQRGYVQDNCRFVLWAINTFKGDNTDAVMYSIAEALLSNRLGLEGSPGDPL